MPQKGLQKNYVLFTSGHLNLIFREIKMFLFVEKTFSHLFVSKNHIFELSINFKCSAFCNFIQGKMKIVEHTFTLYCAQSQGTSLSTEALQKPWLLSFTVFAAVQKQKNYQSAEKKEQINTIKETFSFHKTPVYCIFWPFDIFSVPSYKRQYDFPCFHSFLL